MTITMKQSMAVLKVTGWLFILVVLFMFSGCSQDVVYQRSVSELNQKARQLMLQGDTQGAVSRLESARDLMPGEPSIVYNLAIAYKENGQLDQSIVTFEQFLEQNPSDVLQNNALQSLAVVMEEKADKLLAEAWKQKDEGGNKEPEKVQRLSEEGLDYYERAIGVYQKLLQEKDLEAASREEIRLHIANLEESMKKVREGRLEELRFF